MSKMKILHLAKWYPNREEPLLGIFVQKHIQSVQKYGNNKVINIYQTDSINKNIERVVKQTNGVEEIIFYYKKGLLNKMQVLWHVWKEMKTTQVQLIHAHVMGWPSILAYFSPTPYLISEHWSGYRNRHFSKLNFITKLFIRKASKKANSICTVSDFLKKDMLTCGIKGNYITVENVVEGTPISVEKNKNFNFIFAGDLIQETKNVKGILEAFAELSKIHKDIRLDIIGDGIDRKNYEHLANSLGIKKQTTFHGNQSNEYVFKTLSQAHVLILNSYFETFSVICAEALLCGIPVVSTKCGGPESFLDEKSGLFIEPGNTKQLYRSMKTIMKTYETYQPEHLKNIAKKFSKEQIGEKIHGVYQQILN